ncbi:Extracellular metalloprotease [Lecanosticta acicola]|uniref:Extracellular metalloprotease n=1 Tax=Lecanosticta acicola TaxID=111012 RepID=A0AAI8Z272_9PEZI|nr:Extracellular metalloprotease [Lecanosticta acicola]
MKVQSLFFVVFVAVAAGQQYTRCGVQDPSDALKAAHNEAYLSRISNSSATTSRNVDTYVHVVTSTTKQNDYSKAMVQEQMKVMNDAYSGWGVTFNTVAINFTVNDAWASAAMESDEEYDMKAALRQGSYADLNLYFTSDLPDGLLGFCYFPVDSPTKQDRILDGCMCLADSMPHGSATHYDLGYTAVHETGHWFGLYHTFQGESCSGSGDYVSDTPIQKTPTSGCPARQDSCPKQPGLDNIHNFMDYGYDSCMTLFTHGQQTRGLAIYDQERAGK